MTKLLCTEPFHNTCPTERLRDVRLSRVILRIPWRVRWRFLLWRRWNRYTRADQTNRCHVFDGAKRPIIFVRPLWKKPRRLTIYVLLQRLSLVTSTVHRYTILKPCVHVWCCKKKIIDSPGDVTSAAGPAVGRREHALVILSTVLV